MNVIYIGIKQYHKKLPMISPEKVDLTKRVDMNGKSSDIRKAQAHGESSK